MPTVMCTVKVPLTVYVEGEVTKKKVAEAAMGAIMGGQVNNIDLDARDVLPGYAVEEDD